MPAPPSRVATEVDRPLLGPFFQRLDDRAFVAHTNRPGRPEAVVGAARSRFQHPPPGRPGARYREITESTGLASQLAFRGFSERATDVAPSARPLQ